jgi:SAM-dependent methyltransferase
MDVGCGLGANTKLLAGRNMRVTAVSPVQHHCDLIEAAGLPGVEVRCARFEEMDAADPYDLLLFSESMNHFPLTEEFFEHCKLFLRRSGYMLMADDLVEERARWIEEQQIFRVLRAVDISENVAPTSAWWAGQKRALAAYGNALMAVLEMHDAEIAERVRGILGDLDSDELRMLLSDGSASPASKGRYMIYLLRRD